MNIEDIETAIVSTLNAHFFGGPSDPKILANANVTVLGNSVTVPMRIFRKYPSDGQVRDEVINGGAAYITVNMMTGMTRMERGHQLIWEPISTVPITINTTVNGNAVTITGNPTSGQNVGIAFNHIGYQYRPNDGDTVQVVAQALANAVGGTVSGSTIHIPTTYAVTAGVASDSKTKMELDYQTQRFLIGVKSNNTDVTDAIASQVRLAMARLRALEGPDGDFTERPIYRNIFQPVKMEVAGSFDRNEAYDIYYGQYDVVVSPGILFVGYETIIDASIHGGNFYP